jgi:hypothetical protein
MSTRKERAGEMLRRLFAEQYRHFPGGMARWEGVLCEFARLETARLRKQARDTNRSIDRVSRHLAEALEASE